MKRTKAIHEPRPFPLSRGQAEALVAFLEELDSHAIYKEEYVVGRLAACGIEHGDRRFRLGDLTCWDAMVSAAGHLAAIRARGLGGSVAKDLRLGATGHELVESLVDLFPGLGNPAAAFYGRGRRHQACVDAIRSACAAVLR